MSNYYIFDIFYSEEYKVRKNEEWKKNNWERLRGKKEVNLLETRCTNYRSRSKDA